MPMYVLCGMNIRALLIRHIYEHIYVTVSALDVYGGNDAKGVSISSLDQKGKDRHPYAGTDLDLSRVCYNTSPQARAGVPNGTFRSRYHPPRSPFIYSGPY